MKELTFEDAIPFIKSIPDHDKLTLVGGQALCFWFEFYSAKYGALFDESWLISTQDIDFLGNQNAVRECAEAWHAKAELSSIDDHTPNSGIVLIDFDGEVLRVDFLWNVLGLKMSDIEKDRFEMMIPTSDDKMVSFYILSPLLCLVSRVSNVLVLKRIDSHSLDQLRAAINIVKCLIYEQLDEGDDKLARQVAENINNLASSKSEGIALYMDYGIDVFEAIPEDKRFGEGFNRERYPRMKEALYGNRERLERARKLRSDQKKAPKIG